MAHPKNGDKVKVHYTGKLEDGTIFDSSKNRAPFQFEVGSKMVIPGFEQAVLTLAPGEKVTVTIPFAEAYGPYRKEMVANVARHEIPSHIQLSVGNMLKIKQASPDGSQEGQDLAVAVTEITETHVTLDANHPLAGKDLIFEIELLEIIT